MTGQQWWLYARKVQKVGSSCEKGCTEHYEGTWQPRRNGSLEDCAEETLAANLQFDAFWLSWGTAQSHERPPT